MVSTQMNGRSKLNSELNFQYCRQVVVDFLDLTLLKDMIYVNIVLGISFALYSDVAFFTLQPVYLFYLGFSKVRSKPMAFANLKPILYMQCYRNIV